MPPAQTKHLVLESSARDRSIVTIRLSILDVSAKYLFIEFIVMVACACIVKTLSDMSCIKKSQFLLPLVVIIKS